MQAPNPVRVLKFWFRVRLLKFWFTHVERPPTEDHRRALTTGLLWDPGRRRLLESEVQGLLEIQDTQFP